MSEIVITTIAERPEYIGREYEIEADWPDFIHHDRLANALLNQVMVEFPEFCAIATVDDAPVARARAIPFDATGVGRELFPDGGWDIVQLWGFEDKRSGGVPTAASALEIAIDKAHLGSGLSYRMLSAMREAVAVQGISTLVAPIRPTAKHLEPHLPIGDYLKLTRDDGMPADPWLRVHVRAGGIPVGVTRTAMVIAGSLEEWRAWTGLPFDRSGDVVVPGALVPVHCDVTHEHAAYVEPGIWIRHDLAERATDSGRSGPS